MESQAVVCLSCGRVLDEGEDPAFVTLIEGAIRALCADCAKRPAARRKIASRLGLRPADLAALLGVPEPP